jgi:ABC-type multidrug transport system ATPase subunit
MSFLHADSIRKTLGGRNILNDIFISCEKGEIIGLLGRNGSGKSTLLKIIFGAVSGDNSFVSVDQRKTDGLYSTRNLIGYLPQNNFIPSHKKIRDLISCFCINTDEITGLNFVKPFLDKKVHQLSGGEKRIVEILLMVYSGVEILLLDEPFNGIAPINIETIKTIIKDHSGNKAIIITDHDYQNVISLASKLVLIQDGNTKIIKVAADLVDLGYLPESGRAAFQIDAFK